jgi:hypothetical protein
MPHARLTLPIVKSIVCFTWCGTALACAGQGVDCNLRTCLSRIFTCSVVAELLFCTCCSTNLTVAIQGSDWVFQTHLGHIFTPFLRAEIGCSTWCSTTLPCDRQRADCIFTKLQPTLIVHIRAESSWLSCLRPPQALSPAHRHSWQHPCSAFSPSSEKKPARGAS